MLNCELIGLLPLKIWRQIFITLQSSSTALKAVNQTCCQFYQLVQPILFQYIRIHFTANSSKAQEFLQDLVASTNLKIFKCIRVIIISGRRKTATNWEETDDLMFRLLTKVTRLNIFNWELRHRIPGTIIENLKERQPSPRLYIEGSIHPPDPIVNPCVSFIHSLSLDVAYSAKESANTLRQLISSNPSLHTLKVKRRFDTSPEKESTILGPDVLFPAIQTLELAYVDNNLGEFERWPQCLRTNHLKHLSLNCETGIASFLSHLTGRVPNLTFLEIRIPKDTATDLSICPAIEAFLKEITCLVSFNAYNISKSILSTVTALHGEHLQTLRFRETYFDVEQPKRRSLLSFNELKDLGSRLPNVERLGFDLKFEGRFSSYDILSGFACFPSLSYLELNVPFPVPSVEVGGFRPKPTHPGVNERAVETVFKYVSGEKKYYQKVLRKYKRWSLLQGVDIKVGEWDPIIRQSSVLGHFETRHMFACRPVDVFSRALEVTCIPVEGSRFFDEDSLYERSLASVGLWDRLSVL